MDAKRIKSIRERLRLTRIELAERVGVTVDSVYKWERGYVSPSGSATILLRQLEADSRRESVPA